MCSSVNLRPKKMTPKKVPLVRMYKIPPASGFGFHDQIQNAPFSEGKKPKKMDENDGQKCTTLIQKRGCPLFWGGFVSMTSRATLWAPQGCRLEYLPCKKIGDISEKCPMTANPSKGQCIGSNKTLLQKELKWDFN